MVKNLAINISGAFPVNKARVHKVISILKNHYRVKITFLIINFVSSEQIKKINVQYLNHQYETDILTFNYSGSNTELDGEVFISPQEAAANAKRYKKEFDDEVKRLVIHGFLHLLGFDDKTRAEKLKMRLLEKEMLVSLNFNLLSAKR
ncbi:MAG: rRNA maturation RNase YbeY [Ignavibacteria bacterium CG_4_9_14_3_um_filter_36_18]|nr:MAG: rRNA maturation RNase YbeY [Ignavibacteria bacterium CG_4_9_14_3_um_filter_36_18]